MTRSGFEDESEFEIYAPVNAELCVSLLETFRSSVSGSCAIASSPAWYNDVCFMEAVTVETGGETISTLKDYYDTDTIRTLADRMNNGSADAHALLDLLEGSLSYDTASAALRLRGNEAVIRFVLAYNGGEERCILHAWESCGSLDMACELTENGDFLFWEHADMFGGSGMPDRDDAVKVLSGDNPDSCL